MHSVPNCTPGVARITIGYQVQPRKTTGKYKGGRADLCENKAKMPR